MKSLLSNEKRCYMCGSTQWIEVHHIFFGRGLKKVCDEYGMTVSLCHYCHNEPPNGVHQNKENRRALQEKAQKIAMEHYGWTVEDFRSHFGKNFIRR